jgi:hypothetical protein
MNIYSYSKVVGCKKMLNYCEDIKWAPENHHLKLVVIETDPWRRESARFLI